MPLLPLRYRSKLFKSVEQKIDYPPLFCVLRLASPMRFTSSFDRSIITPMLDAKIIPLQFHTTLLCHYILYQFNMMIAAFWLILPALMSTVPPLTATCAPLTSTCEP